MSRQAGITETRPRDREDFLLIVRTDEEIAAEMLHRHGIKLSRQRVQQILSRARQKLRRALREYKADLA